MIDVRFVDLVNAEHRAPVAKGSQHPDPDLRLVQAEMQDGVVELPTHRQGPVGRAGCLDLSRLGGLRDRWRAHDECGRGHCPVQCHLQVAVSDLGLVDFAGERAQGDAAVVRSIRRRSPSEGSLPEVGDEAGWRCHRVDQSPVDCLLSTHSFGSRREHISQITAHPALVDEARQASCPRQDAEQGHLGQGHGRGSIVDEDDLVTG